MQEIS
jgi:hypothetical protein